MKLFSCALLIGLLVFVEIQGYNEYENDNELELDLLDQNEDGYDQDDDLEADAEDAELDFDEGSDLYGVDARRKRWNKRQTTQEFLQAGLKAHNDYRAKHGSPPLVLDDSLNREAQSYAATLAAKNINQHSCSPCDKYGESLATKAGTAPAMTGAAAAQWAVKQWYDEVSLYPFNNPGGGDMHQWGHFTALIWKGTKKLGLGIAYGSKTSKTGKKMNTVHIVARYTPPGNVLTKDAMKENVQPASG